MGMRTFPALGFDPAPGSPSALLAQAREADRAARALAGAAAAAGRLDARWRGAAADAYREHAPELPGDLGRAAARTARWRGSSRRTRTTWPRASCGPPTWRTGRPRCAPGPAGSSWSATPRWSARAWALPVRALRPGRARAPDRRAGLPSPRRTTTQLRRRERWPPSSTR